jgi:hypothetical protein
MRLKIYLFALMLMTSTISFAEMTAEEGQKLLQQMINQSTESAKKTNQNSDLLKAIEETKRKEQELIDQHNQKLELQRQQEEIAKKKRELDLQERQQAEYQRQQEEIARKKKELESQQNNQSEYQRQQVESELNNNLTELEKTQYEEDQTLNDMKNQYVEDQTLNDIKTHNEENDSQDIYKEEQDNSYVNDNVNLDEENGKNEEIGIISKSITWIYTNIKNLFSWIFNALSFAIKLVILLVFIGTPIVLFYLNDNQYKKLDGYMKVREIPYSGGALIFLCYFIYTILFGNTEFAFGPFLILLIIYLITIKYFIVESLGYVLDVKNRVVIVPGQSRDADSFLSYLNPSFLLRYFFSEKIDVDTIISVAQRVEEKRRDNGSIQIRYILNVTTSLGNNIMKFRSRAKCDALADLLQFQEIKK